MQVSSELVHDRRAWGASVRDVVNSIGRAGATLHKFKLSKLAEINWRLAGFRIVRMGGAKFMT